MNATLLLLPGDGVGSEIFEALAPVFDWVVASSRRISLGRAAIGHAAFLSEGATVSEHTLSLARQAGAVMFGAEDTEAFAALPADARPGSGLMQLRHALEVYANLRPIRIEPALIDRSPLRAEIVTGADLLIVRELLGGLYFGKPRGFATAPDGRRQAVDTMVYHGDEVERVARVAFHLARQRKGRLCSVDKANVLATSILWRDVVKALGEQEYPDVELTHMYVDNCAMQLVREPTQFDVIVTENTFGDILSDCAAMVCGSIGMLPSASLGSASAGLRRGLYEPVHGSAPDIAGRDIANPIGTVLSLAMALEHSLDAPAMAGQLRYAVASALAAGCRTRDIADRAGIGTRAMAQEIALRLPAVRSL